MATDLLGRLTTFTRNQYLQVAFHTLIIHEIIITIDQSVELFWMRPWSLSKVLFLVNRYAGALTVSLYTLQQFVKDLSTTSCYAILWLGFIGSAILILVLSLAVLLRVIALWSHSRLIKSVATLLSLVAILTFVITSSYGLATASVKSQMSPFTGCSATLHGDLTMNLLLIPGFTFETFALVFTLLKVYPMVKQPGVRLPILTLLLSDAIAYYIVIITAQVLSLIPVLFNNITPLFPIVVVSVMASNRLFIRLQGAIVGNDILILDGTTGGNISARVWTETTHGIGGDIPLTPTIHNERGWPIRRPISTQWSDT